jgi:hypothetical protein
LPRRPSWVVQLARPHARVVQVGVCVDAVEHGGHGFQGVGDLGLLDQLVDPPLALGLLLSVQLSLEAPDQPELVAVGKEVVVVAAVVVAAVAATAVAGADVVSHSGGWLCGWWERADVGVVVVVLRSGGIRASCVEIPRERKDAALANGRFRSISLRYGAIGRSTLRRGRDY